MFDYQESKTYPETEQNSQEAAQGVHIRQVRGAQSGYTEAHELEVDERTFQIRTCEGRTISNRQPAWRCLPNGDGLALMAIRRARFRLAN